MKILDNAQIKQKIVRLSYEIMEIHYEKPSLVIAGINNNGERFAGMIREQLKAISGLEIEKAHISLNPASPELGEIKFDYKGELKGKSVIVVDDVANTGRTLFYSFYPLLTHMPMSIEAAVLVDRKHKAFPVKVDFVGLSLATTLKENIRVEFGEEDAAYLV